MEATPRCIDCGIAPGGVCGCAAQDERDRAERLATENDTAVMCGMCWRPHHACRCPAKLADADSRPHLTLPQPEERLI